MPRMVRLEQPGALNHVMARGIDGNDIFRDPADRVEFLSRLALSLGRCGYKCLAWCLMPNHFHLLIRTSESPLERFMRPLNAGYARYFNRKHERRGYLFQDRFKSVLCQDQVYARQVIRYIHLNPVRAGLVESLDALAKWKWCGHGFLLGHSSAESHGFQDRLEALRRFGETPAEAVASYGKFLSEGICSDNPQESGRLNSEQVFEVNGAVKGWPAVIGDPEFARGAMDRHLRLARRKWRQADYPGVLSGIVAKLCSKYGMSEGDLLRRGWRNSRTQARAELCYRAHVEELIPLSVVAQYLGTTLPPVMRLCRRYESESRKGN